MHVYLSTPVVGYALETPVVAHPFEIVAMVIWPDHLLAVWSLTDGDNDYPLRWSLIEAGFSPSPQNVNTSKARVSPKRE